MTYWKDELARIAAEIAQETVRRGDGCLVFECRDCRSCNYFACWSTDSLYRTYQKGCYSCKSSNLWVRISNPVTETGMFE